MADKIKVAGYAQRVFYNNGIEYRNFSDNLVAGKYVGFTDAGRNFSPLVPNGEFKTAIKTSSDIKYREAKSFLDEKEIADSQEQIEMFDDIPTTYNQEDCGIFCRK